MINELSNDSQRFDKNQEHVQNPFLLSDKFLATERAACASLEVRLRNLAEKAASRSIFTGREKQLQWRSSEPLPSFSSAEEGHLEDIAL